MVIIELKGGLGNQMFQYAIASILAKKYSVPLLIDDGFLKDSKNLEIITSRDFELSVFKNNYRFATKYQLSVFNKLSIFNKFKKKAGLNHPVIYNETELFFNKDILLTKPPIYIQGYFQSYKYFKNHESYIKDIYNFSDIILDNVNNTLIKKIRKENSASIHIRRGDFISNQEVFEFHGICNVEYYLKAINYLASNYKNISLFFFSDDIDWAKEQFCDLPFNKYFINQNILENSWKDMCLMHYCKHNIIANSSFSWWAAWLNSNPDKVVIAPTNWVVKSTDKINDRIPKSWLKM